MALRSSRPAQWAKQPLRAVLARANLEITTLQRPDSAHIQQMLAAYRPELVVDVGANQGQYAMRMRGLGYSGEMISFEPGEQAYRLLTRNAAWDPAWTPRRLALGPAEGETDLLVSRNSVSSSTLPVGPEHVAVDADSAVDHVERIRVARLDGAIPPVRSRRIWLKIDVQGAENDVLDGAEGVLDEVCVLQCELSLRPLYAGQADYLALLARLRGIGLELFRVLPGFEDPATGRQLQVDGLFTREPPGP